MQEMWVYSIGGKILTRELEKYLQIQNISKYYSVYLESNSKLRIDNSGINRLKNMCKSRNIWTVISKRDRVTSAQLVRPRNSSTRNNNYLKILLMW